MKDGGELVARLRQIAAIDFRTDAVPAHLLDTVGEAADALSQADARADAAEKAWRCFHCNEVFTSAVCAKKRELAEARDKITELQAHIAVLTNPEAFDRLVAARSSLKEASDG
jgi:hypothetical protein